MPGLTRSNSLPFYPRGPRGRHAIKLCVAATVLCIVATIGLLAWFMSSNAGAQFASSISFSSGKEQDHSSAKMGDYNAGQWVYFSLLLLVCTVNLTVVIPTLTVVLRRRFSSVSKRVALARHCHKDVKVEAILPCFLPNEKDIVEETIEYILKHVESPGEFKLWVVYNTPKDMPEVEARLQALADRVEDPHGRELAVVRAMDSKSKAENINLILPQLTSKYTIIYDADHHPDPESLLLMVEKIERRGVDCVQGSTYIRNLNAGFLARFVDADFFVTHFLIFPGMRLITRNAAFLGSNGMWNTKALQGTYFDHGMQCEDIDVSVRMLLKKHTIDFCPEARSGELAPANCQSLVKQRQRWAIGWDQVSLFHFRDILKSDVPRKTKVAVAWVLYARWLTEIVALLSGVVSPILFIVQLCSAPLFQDRGVAIQFLDNCLLYFCSAMLFCGIAEALFQVHHRGMQSFIQVFFVGLFALLAPGYILFQAYLIAISLFRIATGRDGGWVVTVRTGKKQDDPVSSTVAIEQAAGSHTTPKPLPADESAGAFFV
jgi:cellulose synthase/poly-beta-1,6-N-acetylglucosamine synthase-like glycosyltransferase